LHLRLSLPPVRLSFRGRAEITTAASAPELPQEAADGGAGFSDSMYKT
jgi:hypothetical protein